MTEHKAQHVIGIIVDFCDHDNEDEINEAIVFFACTFGFETYKDRPSTYILEEEAELAEEYLNYSEDLPPFTRYYRDERQGTWGLFPDADELEFTEENVLHVSDRRGAVPLRKIGAVGDLPKYVAHTNDHGNVTLYKVNLEEVWSVV